MKRGDVERVERGKEAVFTKTQRCRLLKLGAVLCNQKTSNFSMAPLGVLVEVHVVLRCRFKQCRIEKLLCDSVEFVASSLYVISCIYNYNPLFMLHKVMF